jgi:predicted RNase H-like HicB family nuclease
MPLRGALFDMSTFTVVIHEEPAGGFWGEVPALPGCYSQGESVQELLENLREAITGVLEVMREEGRAPEASIQVVELAI